MNGYAGFDLRFTDHSRERMRQRGIREDQVVNVVRRGRRVEKRDSDRYEIHDRESRLNGLVVVLAPGDNLVKTAFWRCAPGEEYGEDRLWRLFGERYESRNCLGCPLGEFLKWKMGKEGGEE